MAFEKLLQKDLPEVISFNTKANCKEKHHKIVHYREHEGELHVPLNRTTTLENNWSVLW